MRLTLVMLLCIGGAFSQKKSSKSTSTTPTAIPQKIHAQAVQYNDPMTQIFALHWRIASEGDRFGLRDTLAQAYFQAGMYRQALAVAEELLKEQPRNADLAELRAVSYFYLQDARGALDAYEKLYEITQSPLHLYQVITLQFNLQRYGECQANIDRILNIPESERLSVRISTPDGQTQEVPLRAAALNVRGVLFRIQKEEAQARKAFEEALKIFPNFLLAKGNLEDMSRGEQQPQPSSKPQEKK
ncbi:MAG: tetratricopeptide repeat protein [Bacteroidia bacterium]|nr:tetratricopeptide repeat protein [Bacteroidia bacterium]MCX7652794.1 tetratricopeptide repeat protein [Bacteroidia bacterium]MDW8417215.1 tetratricopeptide repeat protein [Bacteroidia bacterium]